MLQQIAYITQEIYGSGNPQQNDAQRVEYVQQSVTAIAPPWVQPPDGFKSFDFALAVATPIVIGVDTIIVQFTVPNGMEGVINRLGNGYTGPGFVDGSGDLAWRIFVDGIPVQGYDNILVRLGEINAPTSITGVRVFSGQLVQFTVNNVTGALGGPGTQCTGRLGGYFYPVVKS